jgi:hypothetical protein
MDQRPLRGDGHTLQASGRPGRGDAH